MKRRGWLGGAVEATWVAAIVEMERGFRHRLIRSINRRREKAPWRWGLRWRGKEGV